MELQIGSQAPKVPPKIAISHIFVISGGNIVKCKAPQSFLFSFPGRVPVIFHWISEGLCNSSFIEEIFNIKNWKKRSTWIFFEFYEYPDLGKKIFTTWNVFKSEVYLTCINFWKFHDDLIVWLEVIILRRWLKKVKFSVKMQFFTFLIHWKIRFWINDKFEI